MTLTVTNGVEVLTPIIWHEYQTTRETPNTVHKLIGGGVAASLVPARPRESRIQLLFASQDEARYAELMHSSAGVFTIAESTDPTLTMRYIVSGRILSEPVPDHENLWRLDFEVQEVPL